MKGVSVFVCVRQWGSIVTYFCFVSWTGPFLTLTRESNWKMDGWRNSAPCWWLYFDQSRLEVGTVYSQQM